MSHTRLRGDIQGLRAVAVGLVIVAHLATYQAPGLGWLEGGFVGVDVFFVLSGFLITGLLLREVEATGTVDLVGFYGRRARRILPAATLTLVAVVAYAAWRLPRTHFARIEPDAWASALFVANVHFGHTGTSYFDATFLSPLQHYWSLAVEEQFYLAWPLLVLAVAPRLSRRALAALLGVAILTSLAWSVHVTSTDPSAAYFSTPARIYELSLGALLAVLDLRVPNPRIRVATGVCGLAVLGASAVRLGADAAFPGWVALVPTGATALLLVSGHGSPTVVSRLLSVAPMRRLGDLSYSLYLWHFPVIVLAPSYLPPDWRLREQVPVELLLMLGLATVSYHAVEQPFRSSGLARRLFTGAPRRALVLWPTALALVLASTVGGQAWTAHRQRVEVEAAETWWAGHPAPDDPVPHTVADVQVALDRALELDRQGAPVPPVALSDEAQRGWAATYRCYANNGDTDVPSCAYGERDADVVVAAVGDSHMGMWLPALDLLGKRHHFRIVPMIKLGCAPYLVHQPGPQMTQAECDTFRSATLAGLQALQPDAIVASARGQLFLRPRGRTVAEQWRTGVRRTLSAFKAVTPRVTVLGDIPSRPDPDDCLTRPRARLVDCESSPRTTETRSNVITAAVARRLGTSWAPTIGLVCRGSRCPLVVRDMPVYETVSHLSAAWVRHTASALGLLIRAGRWAGEPS